MPPVPRLVLFDIDGTLVSSHGGIGRMAISRVMSELHGSEVEVTVEECAGKPGLAGTAAQPAHRAKQ